MRKEHITYKQNMSAYEIKGYIKAVAMPLFIFILGNFTIKEYGDFGSKLLAPMISIMWVVAAVCAVWVAAQRTDIIRQTIITIGCYCGTLLTFRLLLAIVSGVSSQMLIASFDTPIGTAQGNTMTGYLQFAMWLAAVMTPVGFVGVQVKKIFAFKKLTTPEKAFNRIRSIRKTGKEHIDKE